VGDGERQFLRGRAIRDSDNQASQYVAVINEEMARRYWPDHEAIGRHFTLPSDTGRSIEVVGIAKNSRTGSISGGIGPRFYRPLAQDYQASVVLQLRTRVPLGTAIHETTAIIHSLAPTIPVFDVRSMLESMDTLNGLLLYRLGAVLTASLGLLGLVLAVVGVYGVVSFAVSQRTAEIGIRMAIGAQPRQILLTILGQGLVVTVAGILIGVLAAAAIGNLTRSLLFGVSPLDPVAYFSAAGGLGFVVLVACYIPARRAMRVDPMVVLRYN
jgi:ABC-type antimicrobial peptide transport system permease subunit